MLPADHLIGGTSARCAHHNPIGACGMCARSEAKRGTMSSDARTVECCAEGCGATGTTEAPAHWPPDGWGRGFRGATEMHACPDHVDALRSTLGFDSAAQVDA